MGYDAYGGGTLKIRRDKFKSLIDAAIKFDDSMNKELEKAGNGLEDKLSRVFRLYGYELGFDHNGDVCDVSREYERFSDDDDFFIAITPYVEYCSINYTGEDDAHWRYVIRNGEFHEYNGVLIFPDDPEEHDTLLNYISNL